MRHKLILTIFLCFAGCLCAGYAANKLTKKLAQKGKLEDALKASTEVMADSVLRQSAQTWFYSALVQQRVYEDESAKMYILRKGEETKVDTVRFYSSLYNVFDYLLRCDSIEQTKHKSAFFSKSKSLLSPLCNNLNSGGLFYLKREDYQQALNFFSMLLHIADSRFFKGDKRFSRNNQLPLVAYSATLSAFKLRDYGQVLKYSDMAMDDTAHIPYTMIYKYQALRSLGYDSLSVQLLSDGVRRFPHHDYFYGELINYYAAHTEKIDSFYPTALHQQQLNKDKPFYNYALSLLNLKRQNYKEAAYWGKMAVGQDPVNLVFLQQLGQSYFLWAQEMETHAASDMDDPQFADDRKRIQDTYRLALPNYEKLRVLAPTDKSVWLAALYHIYYKLNMGRSFQEIEKIMR